MHKDVVVCDIKVNVSMEKGEVLRSLVQNAIVQVINSVRFKQQPLKHGVEQGNGGMGHHGEMGL